MVTLRNGNRWGGQSPRLRGTLRTGRPAGSVEPR